MNFFLIIAIVLIVSLIVSTALFALIEKISLLQKIKIVIITIAHPALTALIMWLSFFRVDHEIASMGVWVLVWSLIWLPISKTKYFYKIAKNEEVIVITYLTPLLKQKTIDISLAQIQSGSLLTGKGLFNIPATLRLTIADEAINFYTLGPPTEELRELANSLRLSNLVKE